MYRWYNKAKECLVYLSDVRKDDPYRSIQSSAWFTRGWTVQELLAPQRAIFFDEEWSQLGIREELCDAIWRAAGIDVTEGDWSEQSVACKMSWFAHRHTSRIEDMAYSMLGIFGINMPLIYGEAWQSFRRLQIEILNSTNDESIFAWSPLAWTGYDYASLSTSMLAPHPRFFRDCGKITGLEPTEGLNRPPYAATNKSLQISIERLGDWVKCGEVLPFELRKSHNIIWKEQDEISYTPIALTI